MQLPGRPIAWEEGDALGWERQELGGCREEQEDASQPLKGVKNFLEFSASCSSYCHYIFNISKVNYSSLRLLSLKISLTYLGSSQYKKT